MRFFVAAVSFNLLVLWCPLVGANKEENSMVFVRGADLVGGTNGLFFDGDNNLWVAQVFGRRQVQTAFPVFIIC
jgi:hypothetical protein